MIVTFFGIPRSGKTTLINDLVEKSGYKSIALKKSCLMQKYAMSIYGKNDHDLSFNEMDFIIGAVKKDLRKYNQAFDYVFLDSHVGYLVSNDNWVEIRPEKYHVVGDAFIYLNTSVDTIMRRMRETQGIKTFYDYTLDDLKYYQEKEQSRLKEVLTSVNKDYVVFNNANTFFQDTVNYLKCLSGDSYVKEEK